MARMAKTLDENKHVQRNVQLATKHAFFTIAISAHTTSSVRGVAIIIILLLLLYHYTITWIASPLETIDSE
jgi:hypothetical protein